MGLEVTFAAVQHETLYGDIQGNIKRAFEMIDTAVSRGAQVVCLSYYWFVGHSDGVKSPEFEEKMSRLKALLTRKEITAEELQRKMLSDLAQPIPQGEAWRMLGEKAREHGVHIVGGSGPELDGNRIYHTSPIFGPQGNLIGSHRKSILWDRETLYVTPGNDWEVFDLGICKVANPICSEGQYIPEITRLLALKGADVLVVPNGVHMPRDTLLALPIARAIEAQSFYVMIGQSPRGFRFTEIPEYTSCIVSPIKHMDPVLAVGENKPCVLVARLDVERVKMERAMKTPIIRDYSVGNAVNDMVLGSYSYPMLTEHFLKSPNCGRLIRQYTEVIDERTRPQQPINGKVQIRAQ